ncbi:MAG: putative TrmH family tRNA/rRNA methyltransferase [bacterium ADurb.Bin363]|nr:MAG: putative TrmH family tRNA/rRNA methyltransferase [bacterium ADurb.Bin363]
MEYIKGRNSVREALKSGRPVKEIIFLNGIKGDYVVSEIKLLAKDRGIYYHFADSKYIYSLVGEKHQGVIALLENYNYLDLQELLQMILPEKDKVILALDCIQDPRNLGAILRTAEGAGVSGLIIPEHRSARITPVVEKSSAGALSYIPVAIVTNLNTAILKLKESGFWICGLSLSAESFYDQVDLTGPLCFVLGSEGKGLRNLVEKNCDFTVKIPMKGKINSLNVSVACGIILYECLRQKTEKSKKKPRNPL